MKRGVLFYIIMIVISEAMNSGKMTTILYRLTKQRPTSPEYFNYKITISITRYHYNLRKDIKQKIGLIKTINITCL